MRNAGQSEAASRSASVLKHEVGVCGQGGHAPRRYLGGPGVEYRLFEVPIFANAQITSPFLSGLLFQPLRTGRSKIKMPP